MWLAANAPNRFKEPHAKPPTSLEQYRSAMANSIKYRGIQLRRERGEEIPEAQDERGKWSPLLSQAIHLTSNRSIGVHNP